MKLIDKCNCFDNYLGKTGKQLEKMKLKLSYLNLARIVVFPFLELYNSF